MAAPAPLRSHEYRSCIVMPYRLGQERGTLEMGVFGQDGVCIPETLLRRSYFNGREKQIGLPARPEGPVAFRPEPAIYLGPILDHFGHFILESLARTWFAKRHPEIPVVWSCRAPSGVESGTPSLNAWQSGVLETLGLRNRQILVTEPAGFERLVVPEAGYRIQHYLHPEHAAALGTVPYDPVPGRKVWLSRSRLRQLQNRSMPELEARLADLGWSIVHPERLSFRQQVACLASAERVAGEQGSSLHTLIFLEEPRGLRVDILLRDPTRPNGHHNRNFDTIAEAKGLDQRTHKLVSEYIIRKIGNQIEKQSSDISDYLRALGEHRAPGRSQALEGSSLMPDGKLPSPSRTTSAVRINRLARICAAKSYLEIGVARGETFGAVEIEVKHGVDPKFRFDTRLVETDKVKLFENTSDVFFTERASKIKYDLIFLDGLHTFEQTFRDFCATMPHAHGNTVWIIDDVFPNDVFSALPSQADTLRYRKLHGVKSGLWHGDVFKCIFAINDFFPNFNFRSIRRTHGNPQTVILNRPRQDFKPAFNNLERISRMSYFDFLEYKRFLRLHSDEEVFAWVEEALAS
jgi:hypothetical protein